MTMTHKLFTTVLIAALMITFLGLVGISSQAYAQKRCNQSLFQSCSKACDIRWRACTTGYNIGNERIKQCRKNFKICVQKCRVQSSCN